MPKFTKGKWLIHEGDFEGVLSSSPTHIYYIYPDNGKPFENDFIVCLEKDDTRLVVNAPDMYEWIKKARRFLADLKLYDTDEMRAHYEDMNEMYRDLVISADLILSRIEEKDTEND